MKIKNLVCLISLMLLLISCGGNEFDDGINEIIGNEDVESRGLTFRFPGTITTKPILLEILKRNVAVNKPTSQSSTQHNGVSSKAVDGNFDADFLNGSVSMTQKERGAWLEIDLEDYYDIESVIVFNRVGLCCNEGMRWASVELFRDSTRQAGVGFSTIQKDIYFYNFQNKVANKVKIRLLA